MKVNVKYTYNELIRFQFKVIRIGALLIIIVVPIIVIVYTS